MHIEQQSKLKSRNTKMLHTEKPAKTKVTEYICFALLYFKTYWHWITICQE